MKMLARAISAELLKVKRTLALWMVFVAPLVVLSLQFLLLWQRGEAPISRYSSNPWVVIHLSTFNLYAVGMLPLFITLETALLAGIEHGPKAWKQLFALPVPRATIVTAKMLVTAAMIAMSCIVLVFGTVLCGYALAAIFPQVDFSSGPPWSDLWTGAVSMFLASWLILVLHAWVALRWPSFAFASGFGMSATVGIALIASSKYWKIYPWALPVHAAGGSQFAGLALTLGAFGGLAFAVVACWDLARRDVL